MDYEAILLSLSRFEIPDHIEDMEYDWGLSGNHEFYDLDRKLRDHYGMFALVDMSWTAGLEKWIAGRSCLEVMAGKGWLAKALSDHGCDVVATDGRLSHKANVEGAPFDVIHMEAVEAIQKFKDKDVLIMSWPPYGTHDATRTAEAWGTTRPIVYIGEGHGGCTADDDFHEGFFLEQEIDMPNLFCIHSRCLIGRWKEEG